MSAVRGERDGAVVTVRLSRPDVRNAVDGPTAAALAGASRRRGGAAPRPELAAQLPQTCLREDRASLLEQDGLDEAQALPVELRHGLVSLDADALQGAARFAAGAGRHGEPA